MIPVSPPSTPQIPALDFQLNVLPVRELIISRALSIVDTFSLSVKSEELNAITSPLNVPVPPHTKLPDVFNAPL